jgi:hypothetical protein
MITITKKTVRESVQMSHAPGVQATATAMMMHSMSSTLGEPSKPNANLLWKV